MNESPFISSTLFERAQTDVICIVALLNRMVREHAHILPLFLYADDIFCQKTL